MIYKVDQNIEFHCRDYTRDAEVINDVYRRNKYAVPEDMAGKIVVDIGAFVGAFSILCATRGATVLAIEPLAKSFSFLVQNVKHNKLEDKITCTRIALGVGGEVSLYTHKDRPDFCSLDRSINNSGEAYEIVPSTTLTDLLKNMPVIDMLKCDAEGAERQLCKELPELHNKIKCIKAELHYWDNVDLHTGSRELEMLHKYYDSTKLSDYEFSFKHL